MKVLGSVGGTISMGGCLRVRWGKSLLGWLDSIVIMDEVGFGSITMHSVDFSFVTQQVTGRRELCIDTFTEIAAIWLQVPVDVFAKAAVSNSG